LAHKYCLPSSFLVISNIIINIMASRNRNRQAPTKEDADEERSIWNQLLVYGKRVDQLLVSYTRHP
jgi:hypothetical protein